jgi:hypothetical protein
MDQADDGVAGDENAECGREIQSQHPGAFSNFPPVFQKFTVFVQIFYLRCHRNHPFA